MYRAMDSIPNTGKKEPKLKLKKQTSKQKIHGCEQ
jgi:hypothetical protein